MSRSLANSTMNSKKQFKIKTKFDVSKKQVSPSAKEPNRAQSVLKSQHVIKLPTEKANQRSISVL